MSSGGAFAAEIDLDDQFVNRPGSRTLANQKTESPKREAAKASLESANNMMPQSREGHPNALKPSNCPVSRTTMSYPRFKVLELPESNCISKKRNQEQSVKVNSIVDVIIS